MSQQRQFDEASIWEQVLGVARETYGLTGERIFHQPWGLRDPFRRCALSIMTNIADGVEGDGGAESIRFLSAARVACGELSWQLELAHASRSLGSEDYSRLLARAVRLGRRLSGVIHTLTSVGSIRGEATGTCCEELHTELREGTDL